MKNQTMMKTKELDVDHLTSKKTKTINDLFEMEEKLKVLEHLEKVEIEEKRVVKECDTKLISAKTIEALLKYFSLVPGENRYEMDKKLADMKISTNWRKPNRKLREKKPEGKIFPI